MYRKTVTYMTLVCVVVTLHGCTSSTEISRDTLPPHENSIKEVVTLDGTVYTFGYNLQNYGVLSDSLIIGQLADGRKVAIPLSNVWRVYVMRADAGKSLLIGVAVVAGVFALIAATKQSCPFVYSYEGEHYVFDGEPYGGAICEGLKRTDWSRLEYLKPVNGEYRLLLTNEVDETQYTDELKLWIIDHAPDHEALLDANGNAYTVAQRLKPLRASDNRGKDQLLWLSENDKLYWESDISSRNPKDPANLRDSIRLTFSKPKPSEYAKLIVNAGTTLWGSQMLKRMVQLRGEAIPLWYEEMKSPQARQTIDLWDLREELYHLLVRVRIGDLWVPRGNVLGGGPFITEERVVPLDLRGVEGDSVEILLTPAAGFWQLNSFAVDYSASQPVEIQEIAATSIVGDEGEDLLSVLSATDGTYYPAPRNGQTAKVVFPVPPAKPGTRRTMFAKTSGYYEMRMNISGPPKTEAITRIAMEPGYPAAFAIEEFQKWKSEVEHASNLQTRGAK